MVSTVFSETFILIPLLKVYPSNRPYQVNPDQNFLFPGKFSVSPPSLCLPLTYYATTTETFTSFSETQVFTSTEHPRLFLFPYPREDFGGPSFVWTTVELKSVILGKTCTLGLFIFYRLNTTKFGTNIIKQCPRCPLVMYLVFYTSLKDILYSFLKLVFQNTKILNCKDRSYYYLFSLVPQRNFCPQGLLGFMTSQIKRLTHSVVYFNKLLRPNYLFLKRQSYLYRTISIRPIKSLSQDSINRLYLKSGLIEIVQHPNPIQ